MGEEDAELVRADLERLGDHTEDLCERVFDRWLARDAAARNSFEQNSFSSKREMFDSTLISVYDLIEGADWLKWNVAAYGARHAGVYFVDESMYASYTEAIVEGLESVLGPDFDPAHADAWRGALARICEGMRSFHSIERVAAVLDRRLPR